MMRAYSMEVESLKLFEEFHEIVLKVCGHYLIIGTGGSLHLMAVKSGFGSGLHVNSTLVRMYAVFGLIRFARQLFDEMVEMDIVSRSSMMAAYFIGLNWWENEEI
nr:pentatricopeptide repeat-containing protein At2g34400-like [Solanum lycopersicum]